MAMFKGMTITNVLPLTEENLKSIKQGQAVMVEDEKIYFVRPTRKGENPSVSLDSQEGCYDEKYDAMVEGSN